jgi:hypothetical protein
VIRFAAAGFSWLADLETAMPAWTSSWRKNTALHTGSSGSDRGMALHVAFQSMNARALNFSHLDNAMRR